MTKEHCMLKAKILQDQGKTQLQIAAELGVTDSTIRNYLKRYGKPRSGEAEAIFETRNRTIAKARLRNPLRWRMSKIYTYGPNTVQSLYRPLNPAA